MRSNKKWLFTFAGILWTACLAWGLYHLNAYASTPGASGTAPASWPAATQLKPGSDWTLIVFLHPECSCSKASASELDKLLAHTSANVRIHVLFIAPPGWSDDRIRGSLWDRISSIPNLEIRIDHDEVDAKIFDAKTSGHTLLYSSRGELVFAGGITESRGHEGDNLGRSTVSQLLSGGEKLTSKTNTFGCALSSGG